GPAPAGTGVVAPRRSAESRRRPRAAGLRARQRVARDPVLLDEVRRRITLRGRRAPRAADEADWDSRRRLLEPVARRAPRAPVLRLLLHPHDLLERRVRRDELARRADRERVQLLDARDRHTLRLRVRPVP